jgi:putative aldouronate transport system permease protein
MMAIPIIIWLILFRYFPISGIIIAFKDYRIVDGIWKSKWAGLKYFQEFFTDPKIPNAVINTLGISTLKLVFQFPVPIIFALLINELKFRKFKRSLQTASYFPHFLSYSVVALLVTIWLSPTHGIINNILVKLSILNEPILFLGEEDLFWWIVLFVEIWKSTGWGSIIYLAAIAGIPQELYEAADMDGANRLKKVYHITLPSIKPTMIILLILRVGSIINGANFDMSYLLSNPLNIARAQILDTYVFRVGVALGRFSYGAAVGFLLAVVSLVLVISANYLSRKISGEGLF